MGNWPGLPVRSGWWDTDQVLFLRVFGPSGRPIKDLLYGFTVNNDARRGNGQS